MKITEEQAWEILDAYDEGGECKIFTSRTSYFHFFTRPDETRCMTYHSNEFNFMINNIYIIPRHGKNRKLVIKSRAKNLNEAVTIFVARR